MLRTSLALLSVALLASTAQGQMRGGGAGGRAISGMGAGVCPSGSNSPGTASSATIAANGFGTNAGGFGANAAAFGMNAAGFGTNAAAANAMAGSSNASMSWAGYGTNANASTAATYGMGGYGATAGSNPYAQVNSAYGNASGGFGAMNSMNGGADFVGDAFSLFSAQYTAEMAAFGWDPTDTTPRKRSKSVKSKAKVKHRSKPAKVTSD